MALKEKSKPHLAKLVEENQILFWGQLDVELYFSAHHTVMVSGIAHFLFNGVLRSQLSTINAPELIEKTISEFKWRKLPFTWWTDTRVNPSHFGTQLESYGMTHYDEFAGMALEIYQGLPRTKKNENLSVIPVTGSELMAEWSSIIEFYFGLDKSIRQAYVDFFLENLTRGEQPFTHFLASYGNKPAGAATFFVHQDVGGIYNLCVTEEFRGKGVATALIDEIIEFAKLCGCRKLVVIAPQKSQGLFHNLGFQKQSQLNAFVSPGSLPGLHLHPYST